MQGDCKAGLGAMYLGDGRCHFCVWAPHAQKVELHITAPQERILPLDAAGRGYHQRLMEDGVWPGASYLYRLDGEEEYPDPASHYQPEGVHGPSLVVDPDYPWSDQDWRGLPLSQLIIYELHVGTFTPEGTFRAIIPHLSELKSLGITAIELMPVAQYPGKRGWGYDGVYPYAVQNSYGTPADLKQLVDACHREGLAVLLDAVYNHLGPEGNYLTHYGPYFTERYHTPWGAALNFDGPDSDEVRRFFIANALYWVTEFHFDGLRLDAIDKIVELSARPFVQELAEEVHERGRSLNRRLHVIAESSLNDVRMLLPAELGGYGLDALWNDEFHHTLHTLLTHESIYYYEDYGRFPQLVKAYREGFVYSGEYSVHRRRRHGTSSKLVPAERLVVFSQNHDHVGNRRHSERLTGLISYEGLKVAAAITILSPYVPLLFMGEEYAEPAPFYYFVDFGSQELVDAVRQGRRDEFAPSKDVRDLVDPQSEDPFLRSKLDHDLRHKHEHATMWQFYRELIRLRKEVPALTSLSKDDMEVSQIRKATLFVRRWSHTKQVILIAHLDDRQASITLPTPPGRWTKLIDSADPTWLGPGSLLPSEFASEQEVTLEMAPQSVAAFVQDRSVWEVE